MQTLRTVSQFLAGFAVALLAGCAQSGESAVGAGGPAPAAARLGGPAGGSTLMLEIVSSPRDGMVVVDRQPRGLAPLRLEVPATAQGFLAEPLTIAVRFVARDVTEASMTSSITLYPTDRVPLRLEFERETVKRVLR